MKDLSIIFTVDVEDWYQVENLKDAISRDSWDGCEARIENNTLRLLDLLDYSNGKATFFVLGYIAQRHRMLVKEIHDRGHEVASHGFNHELIYNQSFESFKKDILDAKHCLEDITGEKVIGYRAPAFSITDWAIDILKECGYIYDSSVFPFRAHDRYGQLTTLPTNYSGSIARFENGLIEVSLPTLKIMNRAIAWAGGGYFRLIPYFLYRMGVCKILEDEMHFTFYIHPWEIDPLQPRIEKIRLAHKFRHYINLQSTYKKIQELSQDFSLSSIKNSLEKEFG